MFVASAAGAPVDRGHRRADLQRPARVRHVAHRALGRRIGQDDYVLAAVSIYLDLLNMFMFILSLLGGGRPPIVDAAESHVRLRAS